LKLATAEFYFASHGFTSNDITMKKIFDIDEDDISQCLFRIIPPLTYDTLRKCELSDR
jgi:hypothetical protein